MKDYVWIKAAVLQWTPKLLSIFTWTGYRAGVWDFDRGESVLPPNCDDATLGHYFREAVAASAEYNDFKTFSARYDQLPELYKTWIENKLKAFGYSSKRRLYLQMRSVGGELREGVLVLKPSVQNKIGTFEGTQGDEVLYVQIPFSAPDAQIGAACRLALSRCGGKYGGDAQTTALTLQRKGAPEQSG